MSDYCLSPLTLDTFHEAIANACIAGSQDCNWTFLPCTAKDLVATTSDGDAKSHLLGGGCFATLDDDTTTDHEYRITFCLAYSTWNGRVLFVDQIVGHDNNNNINDDNNDSDETTKVLYGALKLATYRTLALLAIELQCARLTWEHYEHETIPFPPSLVQETLHGWLTLHWKSTAMEQFLRDKGFSSDDAIKYQQQPLLLSDREMIVTCLRDINSQQHKTRNSSSSSTKFRLRLADEKDMNDMLRLVQGLADFEKEPDAVQTTKDDFLCDGFNNNTTTTATQQPPLFYCLLLDAAEVSDTTTSDEEPMWYTCGMAFCYIGWTYNEGRYLYLVDLFIESLYRGGGAGTHIMQSLATIALSSLQCTKMVWQALYWNTPALTFYNKIGACVVDGIQTSRFTGKGLQTLSTLKLSSDERVE